MSCTLVINALNCVGTPSQVEALLSTTLTSYAQTTRGGRVVVRIAPGTAYSLPDSLAEHLVFVSNLVTFPTMRARSGTISSVGADGLLRKFNSMRAPALRGGAGKVDYSVVYETLATFYAWDATLVSSAASTGGPAEFQNNAAVTAKDIASFAKAAGIKDWNFTRIVGPHTGSDPESTLDAQYLGSASQGGSQVYWTEKDWIFEWSVAVLADSAPPKVFSISWGWAENAQCTVDPTGGGEWGWGGGWEGLWVPRVSHSPSPVPPRPQPARAAAPRRT